MAVVVDPQLKLIMFLFLSCNMFSVVSVLFLLDLSYLLFLCVEWCSFIAVVSGCVRVGGCYHGNANCVTMTLCWLP